MSDPEAGPGTGAKMSCCHSDTHSRADAPKLPPRAEFFRRGIAALMEALLFMGLSLPAALTLPLLISQMDASALVPQLPGVFFLEGLLPGLCVPVFLMSLWGLRDNSASLTAATPMVWSCVLGSLLLVNLLYHAILESSPLQGTLGKFVVGLRVVDMKGRRPSFFLALLRNATRVFSTLPLLLGYFMISIGKERRALHDRLSFCQVVVDEAPIVESVTSETAETPKGENVESELSTSGSGKRE